MKYQKSMMKIMENLLLSKEGKSIEVLIKESQTGRNSSFEALKFLEKNGFIKINSLGNQKIVNAIMDNSFLQFKYYTDAMEFKSFDAIIKLIVNLFILELSKKKQIKSALLFGSVLKKGKFNDIDILLLGDNLNIKDLESLNLIKTKLERFFGVIINLHKDGFEINNLFRGLVIYQSSYIFEYNPAQKQYLEFFNNFYDLILDKKDKSLFDLARINLAYSFCYLHNFVPKTKSDALEFFNKKITNFDNLKKIGGEIGKEIFK
jgi:predicted nucleotidyltransferase